MNPIMNDIGSQLLGKFSEYRAEFTAGTTYDAVGVEGAAVDRQNYDSAKLLIPYTTALTTNKKLTFSVVIEDCATSGGTYETFETVTATEVTASGSGVVAYDINLAGAERYIKSYITGDLSHTGTDTAKYAAVFVLGGKNNN
jgi:hypothetical protein